MSSFDRAFSAIKSVMLMNERFDRLELQLTSLGGDLGRLARSHADLGQRVARIEGMIEGASRATGRPPRLPRA